MAARLIAGTAATIVCAATVVQIAAPPNPLVLYNPSESAPVGWYRIDADGAVKRGAMVAAYAPDEARLLAHERGYLPSHIPLIKTVWAVAGEEICSEGGVIRAPNRPDIYALAQDGSGREMPVWTGCIVLRSDEIFLVSTDVQTSFDSRYFGPVPVKNVLGTVVFVGPEPDQSDTSGAQTGRARDERQ